MNKFVDWSWACKTNTLGWEQCDVIKREEMKKKAEKLKNRQTEDQDQSHKDLF
jgi:hypothetical protein